MLTFRRDANCLWVPADACSRARPAPTILFLHGIGERGTGGLELPAVRRWGLPKLRKLGGLLTNRPFPYLVLAPQCPPNRLWCDEDVMLALDQLLDNVTASGAVDPERLVVAGFSMGGIGAFCLALRHPHRFAALVPVCGRCLTPEELPVLAHLPTWIAWGEDDEIGELADGSRLAAEVLMPFGNTVARPFCLGAAGSQSAHARTADAAFADRALYGWLARVLPVPERQRIASVA
jgi:predicted peptidase